MLSRPQQLHLESLYSQRHQPYQAPTAGDKDEGGGNESRKRKMTVVGEKGEVGKKIVEREPEKRGKGTQGGSNGQGGHGGRGSKRKQRT